MLLVRNFGVTTPPLFSGVYPQSPDYGKVVCPVTDKACDEEALWVRQQMLMGEPKGMDDIVVVMSKIQRHSDEL